MLGRALDWAALLRDGWREQVHGLPVSERDVIALGLIAQIVGAEIIHCADPDILDRLPAPDWLVLRSLADAGDHGPHLILAPAHVADPDRLIRCAEGGDRVILYGMREAVTVPARGVSLFVFAMINPAFWNTGLALLVPADRGDIDRLIARLGAILGDQSLDPLDLYEEVCRLRAAVHVPATQHRAAQDLIALRRYVRGLIERAAITARRESARAKPGVVVDWSAAFQVPAELGEGTEEQPDEAEVRARRARIEAEFLRGQLRTVSVPREVNHHDLIAGSGFFDIAWYSEKYDVPPEEAIRHYLENGHIQMNDPSPYFSTSAYFTTYPDVRKHGFNPLLHYLMDGIYEGRAVES